MDNKKPPNLDQELSPTQQEVVGHHHGPLIVVAGAGAGKTRTIAYRVAGLIRNGVNPANILSVTFTNKAAGEMRERITALVGPRAGAIFIGTFHALGAMILRENAGRLKLTRHFSILDRDDSVATIKQVLKNLNRQDERWDPRRLLGIISKAKGGLVDIEDFAANAADYYGHLADLAVSVWRGYEQELYRQQALDFDDLIYRVVQLLRQNAALLTHYRARFTHLQVDEYQDTNQAQYALTALLAGPQQNLCVVGDLDQAIYGWRGADFRNLMRFTKDYPMAKTVLLEQNYRSTQTILAAANSVITNNRQRFDKNLYTHNPTGEKVELAIHQDETAEAAAIAKGCRRLIATGCPPREIAVLYRANFQSRLIEEACLAEQVPYRIAGTRFFERQEIKNAIALLKAALNPADLISIKRIINWPPRGLGKTTLVKLASGEEAGLPAATRNKVEAFYRQLAAIREFSSQLKVGDLLKKTFKQTGIDRFLREGDADDQERWANLEELVSLASKYNSLAPAAGLEQFLTDAALVSDQDNAAQTEGINLSTVHAAKGLEFEHVFISGLEQTLFPQLARENEAGDNEEERRLFYVALTRAKRRVQLSYAASRLIYGQRQTRLASEFIGEIKPDLLTIKEPRTEEIISW